MLVRYLVDTDIASYIINGRFPKVRERLQQVPFGEVAISAITEAELRFGRARNPVALTLSAGVDGFLSHVMIVPWDSNSAEVYATLRADLERTGKLLGAMDLMIAAHALAVDATLVTHDQGFRKVNGLKLADWTR